MFNPFQMGLALSKTLINTYFDHIYYDVGAVTSAEQRQLPPLGERPLLLCLTPGPEFGLAVHQSVAEMKAAGPVPSVFALAGAVSASLGGAAFGRNLAQALDQPVCVILPSAGRAGWCPEWSFGWSLTPEVLSESEVLLEILQDNEIEVSHLVGHSKGCADLAKSLQDLQAIGWPASWEPIVVTLGGVVQLPERLARVHQLLGEYDWLGYFNSRTDLDYQAVAGSGHHLNRQLPYHLDVTTALVGCG